MTGTLSLGLWVAVAAGLLALAGLARAVAARHAASRDGGARQGAGSKGGLDRGAELLTAELAWAALLAPALLLAGHALPRLFPGAGWLGAFAALAFAALVLAGALPARLEERSGAAETKPGTGRPLGVLGVLLRPFASHLIRQSAARPQVEPAAADEEKLLQRLLEAGAGGEAGQEGETALVRHLLGRVLHLREITVERIMRQRSEIVWIGHREPQAAAARIMRESAHSRVLVCGRELDDVIGVLHLKDVFLALHRSPKDAAIGALGREPVFVDREMPLTELLRSWRHQGGTMAIVRVSSGRVVGLVTLSDVLEWLLPAHNATAAPVPPVPPGLTPAPSAG
jgi:CBS domain containing-hemolysin-like protein